MPQLDEPNRSRQAALDADLAARIEQLSARRAPQAPRYTSPPNPKAARPDSKTSRPAKRKRRHAAGGSRKIALALSLATTGGLSYAMSLSSTPVEAGQPSIVATTTPSTPLPPSSVPPKTSLGSSDPTTSSVPTTQPAPTSIVINGGTYSNRYGDVQVQATFAPDGTMTDVVALRVPDGDRTSARISDVAIPSLNSEALATQSADVDTISGATYTSEDYRRSLQSAIDAALASGLITQT